MSSQRRRYYRKIGNLHHIPPKGISYTVSIDALPAELILTIFWLVINYPGNAWATGSPIDGFCTPPSNPTALLRLSHVCKKWQEISLNHGQLWASVIEVGHNHLDWTRELIGRAKSAPLVIRSDSDESPNQDFTSAAWRLAFDRLNNWHTFDIRLSTRADSRPLVAALTKPAPELECFQMHNTYDLLEGVIYGPTLVLSHNLFAGQRPSRLRRFSIASVFLSPSFDFSLWKNLTSLTMRFCQSFTNDGDCLTLSARKWLEILSRTTRLEYLQIWWNVDDNMLMPEADSIMYAPDVCLTHLRALDLSARYCGGSILSEVFFKLFIPETCVTSINIKVGRDQETSEVSFERLMIGTDRIIRTWRAHNRTLLFDLNNVQHYEHGFEISAMDVPNNRTSSKLPSLQFTYRHDVDWRHTGPGGTSPTPFSRMLNALTSMSASSELVELRLHLLRLQDVDKPLLYDFLLGFENIASASIHFANMGILDVLVSGIAFDQSSQSFPKGQVSSILLPNLTSLFCYALSKDFRFIEAYMAWRNLYGKLPEYFEVDITPVVLDGRVMRASGSA